MGEDGGVLGRVMAKLVDTKQKWAREGRLLTGEQAPPAQRLPPGQREVRNWPVLDLGIQPEVSRANWKLEVEGLVENPMVLDFDAFMALLKPFAIVEQVRSGKILMARGLETT